MNGYEYVGIHAVGALYALKEPPDSILLRQHEEHRAESHLHEFVLDALCQFQIENILSHSARAGGSCVCRRVPDIEHNFEICDPFRSAACPRSSSGLVMGWKQARAYQKPRAPLRHFSRGPWNKKQFGCSVRYNAKEPFLALQAAGVIQIRQVMRAKIDRG